MELQAVESNLTVTGVWTVADSGGTKVADVCFKRSSPFYLTINAEDSVSVKYPWQGQSFIINHHCIW